MTWPRKGTRPLVVDGASFVWHVAGERVGWGDDVITVGRGDAPFVLHLDPFSWDGTPKPSIVAAATRWALQRGWTPERGPTRSAVRYKPGRFVFLPPGRRRLREVQTEDAAHFEVDHVVGRRVLAARLDEGEFTLRPETRFGGLRIAPTLTMPRALHPDGRPRTDLFAFEILADQQDETFAVGELVELAPVERSDVDAP